MIDKISIHKMELNQLIGEATKEWQQLMKGETPAIFFGNVTCCSYSGSMDVI